MFEPFFTERKVLIEMQNRVVIRSNKLGDKSDSRSFKKITTKMQNTEQE